MYLLLGARTRPSQAKFYAPGNGCKAKLYAPGKGARIWGVSILIHSGTVSDSEIKKHASISPFWHFHGLWPITKLIGLIKRILILYSLCRSDFPLQLHIIFVMNKAKYGEDTKNLPWRRATFSKRCPTLVIWRNMAWCDLVIIPSNSLSS